MNKHKISFKDLCKMISNFNKDNVYKITIMKEIEKSTNTISGYKIKINQSLFYNKSLNCEINIASLLITKNCDIEAIELKDQYITKENIHVFKIFMDMLQQNIFDIEKYVKKTIYIGEEN